MTQDPAVPDLIRTLIAEADAAGIVWEVGALYDPDAGPDAEPRGYEVDLGNAGPPEWQITIVHRTQTGALRLGLACLRSTSEVLS